MPALSLDELLQTCQPRIARIKLCYGLDQAGFESELLPLIRGYAAYVHLLPATPDQHHAEPGGLLCFGLDVGFYSLQGSDAHIFSGRSTISVRHRLEPLWRTATLIAGLCLATHTVVNQLSVHDPAGKTWPCCVQPLASWLAEHAISHYRVHWKTAAPPLPVLNLFTLPHIVPAAMLQRLTGTNDEVLPHLFACLCNLPNMGERNIIDELVRQARAVVLVEEAARHSQPGRYRPAIATRSPQEPPHAPCAEPATGPATANSSPPDPVAVAPSPGLRLDAPLRLEHSVCHVLHAIVREVNCGTSSEALRGADGLFIALDAFSRRDIEPASAIRALQAARMLEQPEGQQTPVVQYELKGNRTNGVLVHRRWLRDDNPESDQHAAATV